MQLKNQSGFPMIAILVVGHDGGAAQVAQNVGIATSNSCTYMPLA